MLIESGWQDNSIILLMAINAALGAPDYTVPRAVLTVSDIVKIGVCLQDNTYQPAQWFDKKAAGPVVRGIPTVTPRIDPDANYMAIRLAIEPARPIMVSSRGSGIIFEDPFYAVLASFNLGRYKKSWVEVKVSSREQAWMQRADIVADMLRGAYRPERYFSLAGPALTEPGEASLSAVTIVGKDLLRLEINGRAEASLDSGSSHLYLLYRYAPP